MSECSPDPRWTLAVLVAQCVLLGVRALVKHRLKRSPTVAARQKSPHVRARANAHLKLIGPRTGVSADTASRRRRAA